MGFTGALPEGLNRDINVTCFPQDAQKGRVLELFFVPGGATALYWVDTAPFTSILVLPIGVVVPSAETRVPVTAKPVPGTTTPGDRAAD